MRVLRLGATGASTGRGNFDPPRSTRPLAVADDPTLHHPLFIADDDGGAPGAGDGDGRGPECILQYRVIKPRC